MLTNKEFGRQILHIFTGLSIVTLLYFKIISNLTLFLIIIIGFLLSFISKHINLPIISFFLKNFERDNLKSTFPGKGMIFFFIGSLLVIKLFPKDIALASIMILTFGDSVSHVVGGKFGQLSNIFHKNSKKLFEGTLAGFIAGFLAALPFISTLEAFIASFFAMVLEVVKIDFNETTLDDNLVIPLVAGTIIFLLRLYIF